MNYQVILNDQVNIIISNVDHIDIKNEFVSFHDKEGNYVAGFKLEGITGFFTMDQPALHWPDMEPLGSSDLNITAPIDVKGSVEELKGISKKLFGRLKVTPEQWQEMRDSMGKVDKPPENWEEEAQKDFNVQMNEIYRKAKNVHRSGTIALSDIREETNEVFGEGLRRGGVHPIGSSYHYYVRKLIKDKLMRMKGFRKNDKYHYMYDRFEEALAKNMEECLYDYQK